MTDIPHFSLPFRFGGPNAAVVEQDSIDEIADCALATMICPLGYRVELPPFGIPDPTFSDHPLDVDDLRTRIEAWEPRASTLFDQHIDALDALVARVQVLAQVRTQE